MFEVAYIFNQDIYGWDVDLVTGMFQLFASAQNFNVDFGNCYTSSIEDMIRMFGAAKVFDQDIRNWDTSLVIVMTAMFIQAPLFNQPQLEIGTRRQ